MARNVLYLSVALNSQAALKPWAKPSAARRNPFPLPRIACAPPPRGSFWSLSEPPSVLDYWATPNHAGLSGPVHSTQAV